MRNLQVRQEPLGLRPFARAWGADEYDEHGGQLSLVSCQLAVFTTDECPLPLTTDNLLFEQSAIVAHHQVAVDLLNQVEGHADGNQKPGAAVEAGDVGLDVQKARNNRGD